MRREQIRRGNKKNTKHGFLHVGVARADEITPISHWLLRLLRYRYIKNGENMPVISSQNLIVGTSASLFFFF